ncbi:MAG: isocitrate/isopropylmalate dehydrogenase family protein [Candidatus Omnitrophica bacterium]|nr:isocitrate/isopropylmalate dehydrogenase family protein [Candidatus Omnitrophota bacterium]
MKHNITLIPGDGIGPEISKAARRCIEAAGVDIEWEVVNAGSDVMKSEKTLRQAQGASKGAERSRSTPLPKKVLDSIKKNKVAIKGPIITPVGKGFRSVNVQMRQDLDLYACVRPCKSYPGVKSRYKKIDLVVIRENTEDLYAGIEFEKGKKETKKILQEIEALSKKAIKSDSAISIKPISVSASERIIDFAFKYAIKNNRKKVTLVHKANIMKYTDGLFLEIGKKVARKYEGKVDFEERIVDNMAMQLVQKPQIYDCMVLPNLYGDIISDLCAGLVGGLGVAPGANIGDDIALFEPTHGAAPRYKGQNKVNPTAMILSGVLMLRHINEAKAADMLENAAASVIKEAKNVTYDLKENRDDPAAASTSQMADAIIEKLKEAKRG